MRAMVILAAIPAAMFSSIATWRAVRSEAQPILPKSVRTEGVTARGGTELSFARRWAGALDFPPATPERRRYNAPVPIDAMPIDTDKSRRQKFVQRSARLDTCARHGMRKRYYLVRGWRHWRCRR